MPGTQEHITDLLERYIANTATEAEIKQLFLWLKETEDDSLLRERVFRLWENYQSAGSAAPVHRTHFLKTSWFRYAAAIIIIISGAAIWYTNTTRSYKSQESHKSTVQTDIQPGGNRAVLTVGNSTINLSNNKTGITVGNAITYNDGERIADAGQQLTLTTPRGGQYQAVLPDGSKVWLNAASSIKFPSKFAGSKREVEVTGEAYLEISQNAKQPFFIHTNKTTIQVLGTGFNINAYEDEEAEKTTLLEGSVRVISAAAGVILKPGQQAIADDKIEVRKVNTDEVTAWKNGFISFEGVGFAEVMRQLERWYDIEVIYETTIPAVRFGGKMSKNVNLSGMLRILGDAGVHYRVKERKLVILP